MPDDLLKAVQRLLEAIQTDNNYHGGLLSRETIRASDEIRILLSRLNAERK